MRALAPNFQRSASAKVERVGEMVAVYCFILNVWVQWEQRDNPQAMATIAEVAGQAIPRGVLREVAREQGWEGDPERLFAESVATYGEPDADELRSELVMLLSATRWIAGLNLPPSEPALWYGPRVLARPRRGVCGG